MATRGKGGPSGYCADNASTKPSKGAKGAIAESFAKATKMPRTHEAVAPRPRRKRGFGKIAATGSPRFTRFSQF
jgi:hypothetical protein